MRTTVVGFDTLPAPSIASTPTHTLVDEPTAVVINGCSAGETVTITASARVDGSIQIASAGFVANSDGVVDTSRHASISGSYTGVDPFGLWWSARPTTPVTDSPSPPAPVLCRVQVEAGGRTATSEFERHWLASGATATEVRDPGVCGLFARPPGRGPFPGVIAFGGSGGGLGPSAAWAALLASHGFATLAMAYFGCPGLPEALVEIEVEVVERAARWMLDRHDVAGEAVAVMGASRGSELALWSGALLDLVGSVVAFAPSGVSWAGLDATGAVDAPAWTYRGQPLPYAGMGQADEYQHRPPSAGTPIDLRGAFEAVLAQPDQIERAVIPVERIGGPILFVSGEADTMWPSTPMTEIAERRARGHGHRNRIVHLRYPNGGHTCAGIPGTPVVTEAGPHPLTGGSYSLGGTRAGNAHARAHSWPRVLEFLHTAGPSHSIRHKSRRG